MVRGREARWAVAIVVLLMVVRQGGGQQTCTTYASKLYACFPYVELGNSTRLGADCCNPLKNIVETRPDCVCTLQNLAAAVPNVNISRAYDLASLCNIVSTATLSSCNGSSSPAPAPNGSSAFIKNGASMFYVAMMGLALLVCLLSQT